MSTPHNEAKKGDIASTVLMPGDPLRAKYIADKYLEDVVCFNDVRNMFGYTGYYKGKRVSVMGSGMGIPSLSIYVYELFTHYDVESIIRVGSIGGLREDVRVKDIIIAQGACTDSNFIYHYKLPGTYSAISSYELLEKAVDQAKAMNLKYHVGNILSSDIFYHADKDYVEKWAGMGCLGVEMEAYGLFAQAAYLNKKALAVCTVSDSLVYEEAMSSEEREKSLNDMIVLALEIAIC